MGKGNKLASIRTIGGHRRYRACDVYALLNAERRSNRHAQLETLVDDYYGADPTRVLVDLADRYGIAAAVLDRTWFTQFTRRDLTDDEWKRIAAELGDFSSALQQSCAEHLFDYACTVLDTAGVPYRTRPPPNYRPCPPQPGRARARAAASPRTTQHPATRPPYRNCRWYRTSRTPRGFIPSPTRTDRCRSRLRRRSLFLLSRWTRLTGWCRIRRGSGTTSWAVPTTTRPTGTPPTPSRSSIPTWRTW